MTATVPAVIVVPARYGSIRLPGKPLIEIAGRTLLERVIAIARKAAALAGGAEILVATDDERILDHARALECEAVMTDRGVTTGSGRAQAAIATRVKRPATIVNLQGDAPFTAPATVAALIAAHRATGDLVITPLLRLDWPALDALRAHKRRAPFSGTTCVRAPDGRALWFSKQILPAIRDEAGLRERELMSPVFQHIGVYAYSPEALDRFEAAQSSIYERLEGLEQLRFLELGLPIRTIEIAPQAHGVTGIDTPDDIARAEASIAQHGEPL